MSNQPWVVIPTYCERSNISRLIPELMALPIEGLHVLVVDDNSPDKTAEAVRSLMQQHPRVHIIVRPEKKGLGPAYLAGFEYALARGATAVVQMDADFSHDPAQLPQLLAALDDHDEVIGSRYVHGISVINWPLRRLIISMAGNLYARAVTGLPFHDVTGGFRAWRSSALRNLNFNHVKADGYGFQILTTYQAWKRGMRIAEVPIIFTERRDGQSKMSWKIVREALWLVWKLRLKGVGT